MQFKQALPFLLLSVLPLTLLGQAAPKIMRVESAKTEVPFRATLPDEAQKELLNVLSTNKCQIDPKKAGKALRDALAAKRAAIEAKDADYFKKLDEHVAELLAAAQKKVDDEMGKRFAETFQKTFADLKASIEADKPVLRLSDSFRYEAGKRDPGVPGWQQPPVAELAFASSFTLTGSAVLAEAIMLPVPGETVSLPVNVEMKLTLSTDYGVIAANANDLSTPETPVSALPQIKINTAVEILSPDDTIGGNGATTKMTTRGSYTLPRVDGTLLADPKTAG